jgi:branched-subunit amino acid transport protein AzlD
MYCFIYFMFSCVIVEGVPFEVKQVQSFEEDEPQFLGEEGKWFPLHIILVLVTSMLSHFNFIRCYALI